MTPFPICRILLLISSILPFAPALATADQPNRKGSGVFFGENGFQSLTVRPKKTPDPVCSTADALPCVANAFHRAGHPECLRHWAIPSNNYRYGGYYVGGGHPVRGEERCVFHEGTWGWDYFGILFPKNISLNWGHGRRNQGGAGAYKTDGPKIRHE